jgi:peptidoglycan/LPS O-acetylase OafA/YrhL
MASLNAHNDLADTGRGILKLLSRPQDVAVAVGRFLKPEILSRQKSTTHRSDTAYLDGLRGSAALMVCFAHLTVYTHGNIELCAGHEVFPGVFVEPTPAQWPFLRLFFSGGQFSVALFFCISGFVLTQRLISLLHHGHREDFVRSVHSSIFRRPFRLFLPVIWSTLALATFWHVTGWVTPWPARQPNIFLEYWAWVVETGKFIYFFRRGFLGTYYNVHTWTILVELQGSLFIFIWLFALHHLPSRSRILVTVAALFHLAFLSPGGWFACFFAGMLTGEMVLIYAENSVAKISLPWDRFLRALWARPALYHTVLHAMLVVGWYLACQPTADDTVEATLGDCHGWVTLSKLIPPAYDAKTYLVPPAYDAKLYRWFWLFFAAWLVMICARELRWFRYLLERSFPQCRFYFCVPDMQCPAGKDFVR